MNQKITCYSGAEGRFMNWSQTLRGRWLDPLLGKLASLGMRANHITALSLAAGLGFCPAFLTGRYPLAFSLLLLHVLLDGLDGPLARYRGQASSSGSFTDTMADQTVVTVTTLALIHHGCVGAWPGGLYLFLYAIVVGFALVRNALSTPYSWLFRPRFLVFIWALVEIYGWPGSLDNVLWICNALLFLKAVTGFWKIRKRM